MKLKKDFHPRLFGFAGFSGPGMGSLIEKLISELKNYKIGHIRADAQSFNFDRAGAQVVLNNASEQFSLQVRGESYTLEKEFFKDCDVVLVEGHKYSEHPKFLFLDNEGMALQEYLEGKVTGVIGTIYSNEVRKVDGLPTFHFDDIKGIVSYLEFRIKESTEKVLLHGLVLAGGKSSRMGQDKALLDYHGMPQAKYLLETLEILNVKSFVSCREEQLHRNGLSGSPVIIDRFIDFGPLGGILSAMSQYPDKAWLVIACDLPFVNAKNIADLIFEYDPLKQATAYFNEERKQFEPLFTIYGPGMYSRMLHFLAEGIQCPQKVLFNSSVKRLRLETQSFLENANTPEDRQRIVSALEGMQL